MGDADSAPGYLTGSARPVDREVDAVDLPVTGELPPSLSGVYVRNGPNPVSGDPGHWFFGDGMLHGVRLQGGRAAWYRNRWVRTPTFTDGVPVRGPSTGAPNYRAGAANTSVVRHAGRTMALVESSFPHLVDAELATLGPYDFDGRLGTAMTAHPKADPVTGELHFFGYDLFEPYLTYHRADAAGRLDCSRPIEVPGPTMVHDMLLTERHVVFMDLPVVFDLASAMTGSMPFRWDDGYGARLGLLDRADPTGPLRWVDVEPCYVFHTLNAYEHDGVLVAHVVRYPELWRDGAMTFAPTALWRWEVDLTGGRVHEGPVDDLACEMPRIDDRLLGRRADRGWVLGERDGAKGLAAYDLLAGTSTWAPAGPGRVPSEPTFVAADDTPGGPGWLLAYVYDAATDGSELCVWDADDISAEPVARVRLPQRVPDGFHGTWLADPA
ncbi:MAG TPA: carotenoid oxygenase family protein [Acidimicrobiales bacterium]|nr:carotenoid oxygenase family protein [Acidimicrobiales bacterium]